MATEDNAELCNYTPNMELIKYGNLQFGLEVCLYMDNDYYEKDQNALQITPYSVKENIRRYAVKPNYLIKVKFTNCTAEEGVEIRPVYVNENGIKEDPDESEEIFSFTEKSTLEMPYPLQKPEGENEDSWIINDSKNECIVQVIFEVRDSYDCLYLAIFGPTEAEATRDNDSRVVTSQPAVRSGKVTRGKSEPVQEHIKSPLDDLLRECQEGEHPTINMMNNKTKQIIPFKVTVTKKEDVIEGPDNFPLHPYVFYSGVSLTATIPIDDKHTNNAGAWTPVFDLDNLKALQKTKSVMVICTMKQLKTIANLNKTQWRNGFVGENRQWFLKKEDNDKRWDKLTVFPVNAADVQQKIGSDDWELYGTYKKNQDGKYQVENGKKVRYTHGIRMDTANTITISTDQSGVDESYMYQHGKAVLGGISGKLHYVHDSSDCKWISQVAPSSVVITPLFFNNANGIRRKVFVHRECCVCLTDKDNIVVLDGCRHAICQDCFHTIKKYGNKCPSCKKEITGYKNATIQHDSKTEPQNKTGEPSPAAGANDAIFCRLCSVQVLKNEITSVTTSEAVSLKTKSVS